MEGRCGGSGGSGDTNPCKMTGVTLQMHLTRGCIPRGGSGAHNDMAREFDGRGRAQLQRLNRPDVPDRSGFRR